MKKLQSRKAKAKQGTHKKRGGDKQDDYAGQGMCFVVGFILVWFPPPLFYAGIALMCLSLASSAGGFNPLELLFVLGGT